MLFMSINNMMYYKREVDIGSHPSSLFLLGPRQVGKTHLMSQLDVAAYYDLLDAQLEMDFRLRPRLFWEEIFSLKPGSRVVVDEIQKVPSLLDYVQMGIEKKQLQFFLSGSSARKLKKGKANLLGGRAVDFKLHPLTKKELGAHFDMAQVLSYGSLPFVSTLIAKKQENLAIDHLKSYVTTYLKEEVKAEALVRQLGSFQRFLEVAGQCNAQMIQFSNISRECSVPASTVKEYYSVLEDTLIGYFLWPFARSERKKARPKFYFFDCGVVRALQRRLSGSPSPAELGTLFETNLANELVRIKDYTRSDHQISLWRSGKWKIDFLIELEGKPVMAIECKTSLQIKNKNSIKAFRENFPNVPLIICSLQEERTRKLDDNLWIEPFGKTLERYRALRQES